MGNDHNRWRRLIVGLGAALVLLVAGATLPAQATVPSDNQLAHFADCFWLMLTDSQAHAAQCGPSNPGPIDLPHGTTGFSPKSPEPSCCPCTSGASLDIAPLQLADVQIKLPPALAQSLSDEILLACCPCTG